MSTLVVLGGADGAIGTIEAARRLGVRTLCVDYRTDTPGVTRADEFLSVSTRDVDGIERALAGRRDLVGVMSPASDVNLPAQFELSRRLGLPNGLTEDAVRASVDKGFFREVCGRLGLVNPWYLQGSVADVLDAGPRMPWPVMVKPTDSSGGRGVSRCNGPDQLRAACAEAEGWSGSNTVIAEEHVAGAEVSAEALVVDERVALLAVGSRTLTAPPHFVTTEAAVPFADPGARTVIANALDAICAELGYRWGSLNADVIVRPDGSVVILEMGARLGGNGSIELLGLSHGLDANAVAVALAIGARPDIRPARHRHAGFRVLSAPYDGKLLAIDGVDEARRVPGIMQVVLAAEPGDHVQPYTKAGAKIGYLLAAGDSAPAVATALDRAQTALVLQVVEAELELEESRS